MAATRWNPRVRQNNQLNVNSCRTVEARSATGSECSDALFCKNTRARARAWGSVRRAFPSPCLSSPLLSSPHFSTFRVFMYLTSPPLHTIHHLYPLPLSFFLSSSTPPLLLFFHLLFFLRFRLPSLLHLPLSKLLTKRVHVRFRFLAYLGCMKLISASQHFACSSDETQ